MITTTINNINVPVHIDMGGNLYLEHNERLHQLNISAHNEPYFDVGEYGIINIEDKYQNYGIIAKSDKFKNDKYFVEENNYNFTNKYNDDYMGIEYVDDTYCINNSKFIFYKDDRCNVNIYDRTNGQINALYDIFIFERINTDERGNDVISGNDNLKLIIHSEIPNELCIYRVCLTTDGKFYFRIHGNENEYAYELLIENDEIKVKKV